MPSPAPSGSYRRGPRNGGCRPAGRRRADRRPPRAGHRSMSRRTASGSASPPPRQPRVAAMTRCGRRPRRRPWLLRRTARRIGRRRPAIEHPATDVGLGAEVGRRHRIERMGDPGELPGDVRLLGQQQDVEWARGDGDIRGGERVPDGQRHQLGDRLADALEQLEHPDLVVVDEEVDEGRGEVLRVLTDVAHRRMVVRQLDAGQVRGDGPLEDTALDTARDRDGHVGGRSPVGAVTFVPVVVGAGATSSMSLASAVTISWRVAAPSVSPSMEKVAVIVRVARRRGSASR